MMFLHFRKQRKEQTWGQLGWTAYINGDIFKWTTETYLDYSQPKRHCHHMTSAATTQHRRWWFILNKTNKLDQQLRYLQSTKPNKINTAIHFFWTEHSNTNAGINNTLHNGDEIQVQPSQEFRLAVLLSLLLEILLCRFFTMATFFSSDQWLWSMSSQMTFSNNLASAPLRSLVTAQGPLAPQCFRFSATSSSAESMSISERTDYELLFTCCFVALCFQLTSKAVA
jgi:hypothetical protein